MERYEQIPQLAASNALLHQAREIEKAVNRLRALKSDLRRHRKSSPSEFFNACRAHNKCLKAQRNLEGSRSIRRHERAFRSNPWQYAKKACKGSRSHLEPTFDVTTDFNHFKELFDVDRSYSYITLPSWVREVMPPPDEDELLPFDLSPITPSMILKKN